MDFFKIVPIEDYNKYTQIEPATPDDSEIEKIPKYLQKKIKKLIDYLSQAEIIVDGRGIVTSASEYLTTGENILPHLVYSIKGKDRPSDYSNFATILATIKLPRDLLCQKANTDVKRAKRNAKEARD